MRSWRPSTPISGPRSTDEITMSVTPFGIVGALARSIDPGVGHWPAIAGVAKADAAATAMAAVASLVVRLNIAVSLKCFESASSRKAGLQDARGYSLFPYVIG